MTPERATSVYPTGPGVWAAAALGLALAASIVAWPIAGSVSPVAVALIVLCVRVPQVLMIAFFTSLAIPIQRSLAGLPINASDGLLVLWCVLWLAMMQRRGATPLASLRMPRLVTLVLPFVLVVFAAQAVSINPSASLKQALRIVEWFVVVPLVMTALVPDARFRAVAATMLMVVPCLFAIDGLYEQFMGGERLSQMIGISVPVPEGSDSQIRHTFDVSGRAGSTFGGAQGLAMYLVMTIGASIAHVLYPPAPWMRRLALVCFAISCGGLAVAQSRGGLLGAAALLVAFVLVTLPRTRLPLLLLAGFAASIALVVLGLLPNWNGTIADLVPGRPEAVLDRLIIWQVVLEVAAEHPLLGVGLGNFRDAFFAREPWLHVELAYPSLHAHNTYLELLADTGWIGLLAYLFFLAATARTLLRQWARGDRPPLTLAAIGALAAYAVFASVDMLLLQNIHMMLMLILSLGIADARSPTVGVVSADEAPPSGTSPATLGASR